MPQQLTPQPRTTKAREPGSNASRPHNLSRVLRTNVPSDPGNYASRPTEKFIGQISSNRSQRPITHPSGHDRSDRSDHGHDPIPGRSSRPTVRTPRSTRNPF
ncbi:unnamed protein product [Microthlaspi erraticum]|uniref:Uncharacterized protein n=1 Tax=Microthlaspi erraticum TaxID=1685480 RepID=A0A6D2HYJ3_9BRAS|nr:unnamed protein product [Microthlaspi erraticum]